MAKKDYKRPDEAAMNRVLEKNRGMIVEIVLRLAWTMGLSVTEIHDLKWTNISFDEGEIRLPNRSVPMPKEIQERLRKRYDRGVARSQEFVVISDVHKTHMHRVYISKIAKEALSEEEVLKDIYLKDLREDFVIRLLEKYDWPYAARLSGASISTLYSNYKQYMKLEGTAKPAESGADEFAIWQVLQAEGSSPAGLALWLVQDSGLSLKEIAALTWDQVDMTEKVLCLPDRVLPMGTRLERLLREVEERRTPDSDPHVLLTPRAKGPFDPRRLGLVVRQALIKGGLDEITAEELIIENQKKKRDVPVLQLINQKGSVSRNEIMDAFGLTQTLAWESLNRLVEKKEIVRVGLRYFKAGTVVHPKQQYDVVYHHLKRRGTASRQELALLLNLDVRQCDWIFHQMVEEGKLAKQGRRYCLPENNEESS